ncbi:2573_t:CDS:2 [Gigaspora margarita]|uniref:2573_t:CDS:1 n=1 Tax=Gigaspora margarita TaxID=4874 RepID=A0ABM8W2I6_GIGMA|nr:2573_t:CDS:2 [Gigaspora margarita]
MTKWDQTLSSNYFPKEYFIRKEFDIYRAESSLTYINDEKM